MIEFASIRPGMRGTGGFDLGPYPAIRTWLDRVASHPRHVGMLD